MRLTTIVLTVLFFGSACVKTVPEGVVPQRQMTALLLDMHLVDGQLASMVIDSARAYRDAYYDAIFSRYAIDSTAFERSIEFYSERPELMKKMYIDIEKQLEAFNTAEQQAVEEKYATQRKADSLTNARRADSLRNVMRDSLDFKRRRYLLYVDGADSLEYGQPVPVTHTLLKERMLEAIGLPSGSQSDAQTDVQNDGQKPTEAAVSPATPPTVQKRSIPPLKPIKKIK